MLDTATKKVIVSRDVQVTSQPLVELVPPVRMERPVQPHPAPSTESIHANNNSEDEPEALIDNNLPDEEQEIGDVEEAAPGQGRRQPRQHWQYEPVGREGAPSPEPQPVRQRDEEQEELPATRTSNRLRHQPPAHGPLHQIDMAHSSTMPNITAHQEIALASAVSTNPDNYRQARLSPFWTEWQAAMKEELDKMVKYNVWEVVKDEGQRRLSGKWVFTRKLDGVTGKPKSYKARFVVRGFLQREGRDYGELFASVAHKDSIRVFLAIVNYLDLECDQVDIIGAFLNGEIDRLIFVEPPEGSDIPAGYILRLIKSLYGLRQSVTVL